MPGATLQIQGAHKQQEDLPGISKDAQSSSHSPSIPEIGLYVSVSFLRTFPVKRFPDSTDPQQRYTPSRSGALPVPGSSAVLPLEPDTRLFEYISHPVEGRTNTKRLILQIQALCSNLKSVYRGKF